MSRRTRRAEKVAAEAESGAKKRPRPLTGGEQVAAVSLCVAGLIVIGATLFAVSSVDSGFTFKAKEKTVVERAPAPGGAGGKPTSGSKGQRDADRKRCIRKQTKRQRKRCHRKLQRRERLKRQRRREERLKQRAKAAAMTSREVDYSDAFAIFALTLGAALALAGGFYSRLRSLKLGGLEIGLGAEVEETVAELAEQKVEEKIEQKLEQKAEPVLLSESEKDTAKNLAQRVAIDDLTVATAAGVKPTEQAIEVFADQAAEKIIEAMA